ncbi:glycoside hydrolase family protein [Desulfocastanea catecholica]
MSELQKMLIRHEGLRLQPYRCPAGKLTIGVGHNLDDNGISKEIAMVILQHDIAEHMAELNAAFPWIRSLNYARQDAMVDMAFNLGLPRFAKFKKMLAAMEAGDYATAHDEMLDSKWARQVGGRAQELARMTLTGAYAQGA